MCAGPLTSALPNHRKELERRGADNTEQPGFAFAQSLTSLDLPGSPDSTTPACVSAEIGVSLKIPTVSQHVLYKNHITSYGIIMHPGVGDDYPTASQLASKDRPSRAQPAASCG